MYIDEQIQGTIYFVDGTSYQFDSNNIIDNDVSILQQATADNSFSVGGTYSSTLNMTIRIQVQTNSYDIIGSKIILKSKYGSENYYIMRGIFWVTSASRYKDIYTISASDAITWLDSTQYANSGDDYSNVIYKKLVAIENDGSSLQGELQKIVESTNLFLTNCNVGIIETFTSNTIVNNEPPSTEGKEKALYCVLPKDLTGESANPCPRDYAGWLAQIGCGFLECVYLSENDETPYISIGQFEMYANGSETLNWSDFEYDTLEIANFEINCCQVYVEVFNGVIGGTDVQNKRLNSIVVDVSGNLFVDGYYWYRVPAGENPFTTNLENHNCVDILNNMFDFLKQLHIKPFSGTYHGEKRLKLGQCIRITDEYNSEHITTLTRIQWNFRGGQEIKCSGEDNRVLFDSARRTPSKKAKEEAITKLNYVVQETAREIKSNYEESIAYVDQKFQTKIEDTDGKVQDIDGCVNSLWNSMYAENDTVDSLRKRIEALEENQGG